MRGQLGGDFGGAGAVAGEVEEMRRAVLRSELDGLVVDTGRKGGIGQRGQRRRLELDLISGFALDRQRAPISPSGRDLQRSLILQLLGRYAFGIHQELMPVEDRELRGGGASGGEIAGAF